MKKDISDRDILGFWYIVALVHETQSGDSDVIETFANAEAWKFKVRDPCLEPDAIGVHEYSVWNIQTEFTDFDD